MTLTLEAGSGVNFITRAREDSEASCFAAALAVAILVLLPRLSGFDFDFGRYLWAEDGAIFLNQAQDMGAAAILRPHQGYFVVYPRIVAFIAQWFEFIHRPIVLFAGWCSAYLIFVHALVRTCLCWDRNIPAVCLVVALAVLQPNYGEVFFTITNLQWLLGAALALYCLSPPETPPADGLARSLFLFLLAMTGPYSLLLLPALAIRAVLRKDITERWYIYLPVLLGGLAQACALSGSSRLNSHHIDPEVLNWSFAFGYMLLFSAAGVAGKIAAAAIWAGIIWLMVARLRDGKGAASAVQTPMLLLFTAMVLMAASIYAWKAHPFMMVIPGGGNRYSWIPYTLILMSAFILTAGRRKAGLLLAGLFAFICLVTFPKGRLPNLQFNAFARLAQVEPVLIPMNPRWDSFPGWYIDARPGGTPAAVTRRSVAMDARSVAASGLDLKKEGGWLAFTARGTASTLTLRDRLFCPGSDSAAVDIRVFRREAGLVQFFWSADGFFASDASFIRWYPSGEQKLQFAFPIDDRGVVVRLDPELDHRGAGRIEEFTLLCL